MLDGEPISASNAEQLTAFAQWFLRQAEACGLRIPDPGNNQTTWPLGSGPTLRPDTGPLRR
jgi:hypothetical protein